MLPGSVLPPPYNIVARNLIFFGEFVRLHRLMVGAGLSPLVVKGAWMILSGRRTLEERGLADIDLLLRPEEVAAVSALLEKEGYVPLRNRGLLFGQKEGPGPVLDLSGGIWYLPGEALYRECWDRVESSTFQGQEFHGLSVRDHFLYQAVHALVHHGSLGEKWRRDLVLLWQEIGTAPRLADLIAACRLTIPMYYLFLRLRREGQVEAARYLPVMARTKGGRGRLPFFQHWWYRKLAFSSRNENFYGGEVFQYLFHSPWPMAAREIARIVFPETRTMERMYGKVVESRAGLIRHYLRRWWHLARTGRLALKTWRRK